MSTIPSKEDAPLLAESIARAGYNSVRLHHYDNYIVKKDGGTTTELDPEKIDRMDFLVKQLRGGFRAFFWQGIAKIFGADLKDTYDELGEDQFIEDLIMLYEAGLL